MLFVLCGCFRPSFAAGKSKFLSVDWPQTVTQGEAFVIRVVSPKKLKELKGELAGKPVYFAEISSSVYLALAGIDVEEAPGRRDWKISALPEKRWFRWKAEGSFEINAGTFPVQRLTLPPKMVTFDEETQKRVDRDSAKLKEVFGLNSGERLWHEPFVYPVRKMRISSAFGLQRIMNDEPRPRHTGVDFRAPVGEPILAVNAGRVALVDNQYLGGNVVAIDHGWGIFSVYSHLDATTVKEGERVLKGQMIGRAGQTGRASGPHLHFAFRLNGARVDPMTVFKINRARLGF